MRPGRKAGPLSFSSELGDFVHLATAGVDKCTQIPKGCSHVIRCRAAVI